MNITYEHLRSLSRDDFRTSLTSEQLLEARQVVREVRDGHFGTLRRIMDAARAAGRDLTRSQQADYDVAERGLDEATALAEQVEDQLVTRSVRRSGVSGIAGPGFADTSEYRVGSPLGDRQSVAGYVRSRGLVRDDEESLSFGRYIRGMVTGRWDGADAERRALVEGTASAGGHLVPTPLSARIIDRARNATRVMQAGAQVVPMEAATLKLARVVGDPTAAWHTEMAAISASDMTFDAVTLTARALASRVLISRELMEDADNEVFSTDSRGSSSLSVG